jgi:hypothetical protein
MLLESSLREMAAVSPPVSPRILYNAPIMSQMAAPDAADIAGAEILRVSQPHPIQVARCIVPGEFGMKEPTCWLPNQQTSHFPRGCWRECTARCRHPSCPAGRRPRPHPGRTPAGVFAVGDFGVWKCLVCKGPTLAFLLLTSTAEHMLAVDVGPDGPSSWSGQVPALGRSAIASSPGLYLYPGQALPRSSLRQSRVRGPSSPLPFGS